MNYILYISITLIILIMVKILKENKFSLITTSILTIIIIFFIFNPKGVMDASMHGATLFFNSVFPTLFPFLIVTDILMQCGGINIYSKILGPILCKPLMLPKECSLPLVVSALCGYPLGAKYSCDLYDSKSITHDQFARLFNIASNVGPLFILGTVCNAMLKLPNAGPILIAGSYISCIIMAFILPKASINSSYHDNKNMHMENNIGIMLKKSLDSSLSTCLMVGGFIVLFSVGNFILSRLSLLNNLFKVISQFFSITPQAVKGLFLGLIEITNGCSILSSASMPLPLKLGFISFLCSFSGLCIIFQVYSFAYKMKDISIKRYIFRKFIQGIISFFITYILSSIFNTAIQTSTITDYTGNLSFLIPTAVLIFFTILSYKLKALFHIS